MSDPIYSACVCRECECMDLSDTNSYDEAYCTEYRKYYNPNDRACSKHFKYNNQRNPRSDNCYITTVIDYTMGGETDYLKILRDFRDNFMKKDNDLLSILYEYDVIGPVLAHNLSNDSQKKFMCNQLLSNYILPIVDLIKNDQKYQAVIKYTEMINSLKTIYKTTSVDLDYKVNKDTITGKGYLLIEKK